MVLAKEGGVPGFTAQLFLVPSLDLGIGVFVNSRQTADDANDTVAQTIGQNILNALVYSPGAL
jgi:hypothetical protein